MGEAEAVVAEEAADESPDVPAGEVPAVPLPAVVVLVAVP
jgi:hypothetical protein